MKISRNFKVLNFNIQINIWLDEPKTIEKNSATKHFVEIDKY